MSAEAIVPLACARMARGSNLGRDIDYPNWGDLVVFLSPSSQMPRQYINLGHDCFLPHIFQVIIHYLPVFLR
jgi:hypothetical protein